jgi:O-antigen ligase
MVNRITLTLVFALSFWTYLVPEPNLSRRSAALILFVVLVFFKVFCSFSVLRATGSLFAPDGLLFLLFLSFLMLGSSLASNFHESIEYWLLISVCLVLARLYMAVVPLQEVLEAFFWSGILSLGVFMGLAFADLKQSIFSLTRFSAFAFEPNVLAFVLAGYFCAVVWKFMTGGWCTKLFAGLVGFTCLGIIFFASSRGSLVAVLVGCLFVGGMTVLGGSKEGRKRSLRLGLLTSALLLGVVFAAESRGWTGDTFNFVDQVLALSAPDRGLDSGFTGRFDKWKETVHALSDGTWLTGRGLRSSDSMYPPIDNSYLVLLYEVGLFPLILITWRFFGILRRFVKSYFRSTVKRQRHFYLAWTLLIVVFLVNDIVGRFMFALANPYSLLAFLIFAAPAVEMQVYPIFCTSV